MGSSDEAARPEREVEDKDKKPKYRYNTQDYETVRSRHTRVSVYGGDTDQFLKAHLAFHPEILKQAKLILAPEKSFIQKTPLLNSAMKLSQQAKQSLLSGSGFHWAQIGLRGVQSGVNY